MTLKIKDQIKINRFGDKVCHPRETIKNGAMVLCKLRPPISVRFKRLDHLDKLNIPIYYCKTNKLAKKIYPANWIFKHESFGKGRTIMHSKASAKMELLERLSCYCFFGNKDNFIQTTHGRIGKKTVLKNLLLFLPEKLRTNKFVRKELTNLPFVWARSYSLTKNKNILFPIKWFVNTTTGFASGNCIEEAILQGICEFVERHQIKTIADKKIITPLIDIQSIDDIYAKNIISKFQRAGVKLFIKDFSNGFEIPTIGILAYDSKGPEVIKIYCAAGTSLNKNIALIRALTEIAQHRSLALFKKRTLSRTFGFPGYRDLKDAAYIINSNRIINFSQLPTYSNKNIKVEIKTAVKYLKNKGFEIIATDATHHILRIPTVIITIPGMRIPYHDAWLLFLCQHNARLNYHSKTINILKILFNCYPTLRNRIDVLFLYGSQYEKLRMFKQAIKIYERMASLIIMNKDNKSALAAIYRDLIRCYAKLGKTKEQDALFLKLKNL